MADVWANSMTRHPTATCHTAGWYHLANLMPHHPRAMYHKSGCCHYRDSKATCHIARCSHLAKSMSWLCHEWVSEYFLNSTSAQKDYLVPFKVYTMDKMIVPHCGCKNSIRHTENRFSNFLLFFVFFNAVWALTSDGFVLVALSFRTVKV